MTAKTIKGKQDRQPFGTFVRLAIRTRVPEARAHDAHWWSAPNIAWVRWQREDGRYAYCCIRRRRDWLTGEIGIAAEPFELEQLAVAKTSEGLASSGTRITLGYLISGHDQWWTTGGNESGFLERLDWLAHQLKLRLHTLNTAAGRDAA
jgi:hypothetical protein